MPECLKKSSFNAPEVSLGRVAKNDGHGSSEHGIRHAECMCVEAFGP